MDKRQNAVVEFRLHGAHIDALGAEAPAEGTVGALLAQVTALALFLGLIVPLGADGQAAVAQLDVDVVLLKARQVCLQNVSVAGIADIRLKLSNAIAAEERRSISSMARNGL